MKEGKQGRAGGMGAFCLHKSTTVAAGPHPPNAHVWCSGVASAPTRGMRGGSRRTRSNPPSPPSPSSSTHAVGRRACENMKRVMHVRIGIERTMDESPGGKERGKSGRGRTALRPTPPPLPPNPPMERPTMQRREKCFHGSYLQTTRPRGKMECTCSRMLTSHRKGKRRGKRKTKPAEAVGQGCGRGKDRPKNARAARPGLVNDL